MLGIVPDQNKNSLSQKDVKLCDKNNVLKYAKCSNANMHQWLIDVGFIKWVVELCELDSRYIPNTTILTMVSGNQDFTTR